MKKGKLRRVKVVGSCFPKKKMTKKKKKENRCEESGETFQEAKKNKRRQMASNEPSGKVQSNFRRGFRSNALMGFRRGRKEKEIYIYKKIFQHLLRFAYKPCLKE